MLLLLLISQLRSIPQKCFRISYTCRGAQLIRGSLSHALTGEYGAPYHTCSYHAGGPINTGSLSASTVSQQYIMTSHLEPSVGIIRSPSDPENIKLLIHVCRPWRLT